MSDKEPPPLLVVALGGNAIQDPRGDDSIESDFARARETARHIAAVVASGWRVVIAHGNGPQVGNHLLRSELGHERGGLPLLPLDVCVADTQGGIGYMLQQCIGNELHDAGFPAVVVSVVTQMVVDERDPAFEQSTKPIGEMIAADLVEAYRRRGWTVTEDRAGWRRVVPSPDPAEIVEADAIRSLVDEGVVVVAGGGGGIPVIQADDGSLQGVPAVVDKDLSASLLARDLKAETLLVLTDVDKIFLDFDSPRRRPIDRLTVAEARDHLSAGQFPSGSMGPKVEAMCRFVEATGRPAIVSSIEGAEDALSGTAGTRMLP